MVQWTILIVQLHHTGGTENGKKKYERERWIYAG